MAKDNLEERLRTHVSRLAGDIGERNVFRPLALEAASSYLERQWREQGYAIETLAYEVSSIRCANLEVTRRGGVRKGEILLIGAHYDSVMGSPGANDNASGIAALLEISRMFTGIDPTMTVRFIAFVNEEPPFFRSVQQGSMVYAAAARRRSVYSIRLARTSSESYRISAQGLRCSSWRQPFVRILISRWKPRRRSDSFLESRGAITGHFGDRAIEPS